MYKVIGIAKSRAMRVMWVLEELGQPFEMITANPRDPIAQKYNPLGKVPALVDGNQILTDSVAIMTYLADKHQALTAPAGTIARAQQDAMTHWLLDEFDAVLWSFSKHKFVLPKEERVPEIHPSLHAEFTRSAAWLEARLQDEFLMGKEITLPDILAVHCLGWAFGAGFPPAGPKLKDYIKRLRARPAFRAAAAR